MSAITLTLRRSLSWLPQFDKADVKDYLDTMHCNELVTVSIVYINHSTKYSTFDNTNLSVRQAK